MKPKNLIHRTGQDSSVNPIQHLRIIALLTRSECSHANVVTAQLNRFCFPYGTAIKQGQRTSSWNACKRVTGCELGEGVFDDFLMAKCPHHTACHHTRAVSAERQRYIGREVSPAIVHSVSAAEKRRVWSPGLSVLPLFISIFTSLLEHCMEQCVPSDPSSLEKRCVSHCLEGPTLKGK